MAAPDPRQPDPSALSGRPTDTERGTSGGRPTAAERMCVAPAAPASPILGSGFGNQFTPAMPATPDVAGDRRSEIEAGFARIARLLSVAQQTDAAKRLMRLAETLASPNNQAPFYSGMVTGLQLGVTQACVEALSEYRASLEGTWDTVKRALSGDEETLLEIAKKAAQIVMAASVTNAEDLDAIADLARDLAKRKGNPELSALCVDFAVAVSQVAKTQRALTLVLAMPLGQVLDAIDDAISAALMDELRELVERLMEVSGSAYHVGEELGMWLGALLANMSLFAVEMILPISPGRERPSQED
ncbi:MAG: hypothetical protein QM820_40430 [Minicystis sp.]